MSIWLQKSASIQPRKSLSKFEDHRFCRSQFRSHAKLLVVGGGEYRVEGLCWGWFNLLWSSYSFLPQGVPIPLKYALSCWGPSQIFSSRGGSRLCWFQQSLEAQATARLLEVPTKHSRYRSQDFAQQNEYEASQLAMQRSKWFRGKWRSHHFETDII